MRQCWIVGLLIVLMVGAPNLCRADLRSAPAWFDTNGVGIAPDWHYRVPISIPSGTAVNSTIRIDVDFDTLLSGIGISGTFDTASPRIVRSNGSLAAIQQFTDAVYMGASDAIGNSRGEVRFILEDSWPATYNLYFDITQNGTKTSWPAANTINGNFEFGSTGQTVPAGWAASANAGFDAQVRPSENPSINSNTTGADTPFVTTDGTPNTGQFSFLLGARTQNEPGNGTPAVTLSRTLTVAAANPGDLTVRYRLEGWDSSADAANQFDFIRIRLVGSSTMELVGPTAGNYGIFPFAPNYGTTAAGGSLSGYGQYNGWDTDTGGTHYYSPAMTLTQGSEPWFTVSTSLNAFVGQSVTLEITTTHVSLFRSWCHVDDVEWSVTAGTLGNPQAFGANIVSPLSAVPGSVVAIGAMVDAHPTSIVAHLYDELNNRITVGAPLVIDLFDDGTHGDSVANDGSWTNDGSDAGSPTTTIPAGTSAGVQWTTLILALDGSGSIIGATNGLVHIPGQPASPENHSNFFNIDQQTFTIIDPAPDLSTSTKSVVDLNGGSLYPGDVLRYTITLVESAGIPAAGIRVTDVIPAHVTGFAVQSIPAGAADASSVPPPPSGPNGTGYLDVSGISLPAGGSDTIVFDVTVAATATTGATIDNTAAITVPGGIGAYPAVASPPVNAIPAAGNKPIYLRTNTDLSRTPPAAVMNQRIGRNNSHSWTLTPALQQPLTFRAGAVSVPVRLMLRHANSSSGNRPTAISIALSGIGFLNNIPITVNGSVQAYNFLIPFSTPPPFTLNQGTAPLMTVSTSDQAIRIYTTFSGTPSRILLDVDTVINVDSVAFYDNAYAAGSMVTSSPPGNTVYIRAAVSDPFGSFDITGANVNINGPLGNTTNPMIEVQDSGAASKIYEFALNLPAFGSDGTWTAVVTAAEGTEGTITHQGTAALLVGAPLLTVLKSANSVTANPGDLIIYTIQVVNTGTGPAINVELDDAMSPYTALRIAYDGIDVLPFRLVGAPGGLTLGSPLYSDNGGATYAYSPLVSGGSGAPAGYDGSVTHWRLSLSGTLGGSGSTFTMHYQVIVK